MLLSKASVGSRNWSVVLTLVKTFTIIYYLGDHPVIKLQGTSVSCVFVYLGGIMHTDIKKHVTVIDGVTFTSCIEVDDDNEITGVMTYATHPEWSEPKAINFNDRLSWNDGYYIQHLLGDPSLYFDTPFDIFKYAIELAGIECPIDRPAKPIKLLSKQCMAQALHGAKGRRWDRNGLMIVCRSLEEAFGMYRWSFDGAFEDVYVDIPCYDGEEWTEPFNVNYNVVQHYNDNLFLKGTVEPSDWVKEEAKALLRFLRGRVIPSLYNERL